MNFDHKIKEYLQEYKHFMEIDYFPEFELQTKEVSLSLADKRGYDSAATTFYDVSADKHTLIVSTNLQLSKYLIFHELTHVWDTEMYARKDKIKYAGLSGFTEYHASQIELMILLGASFVSADLSFSMMDKIETFAGTKTVQEYVTMKYHHAVDLFKRQDFPADIAMLKTALGVWYNYMGLRSICEKYTADYSSCEDDNWVMTQYIPSQLFVMTNILMQGWLEKNVILEKSIPLYVNTILPIIDKYCLK